MDQHPAALTAARAQLEEIQSRLLDVGSAVATPAESSTSQHRRERVTFDAAAAAKLEAWIDAMDEELPQLRNFILPSGMIGCGQGQGQGHGHARCYVKTPSEKECN